MADNLFDILEAARYGFTLQEAALEAVRARERLIPAVQRASGSASINETFSLDWRYRLVFVRCHLVGGTGTAAMAISVDSTEGSYYDTRLFTLAQVGTGYDVNFRIGADEVAEPSPWSFQAGDELRITWANPDSGNMSWGIDVGLVLAL